MSKQFDSKRETVARINKMFTTPVTAPKPPDEARELSELRFKYNLLLSRYQELQDVYNFHRNIVQNISSGLLILDNNGIITFANKAACEILDLKNAALNDQPFRKFFANPEEGTETTRQLIKEKKQFESKETHFLSGKGKPVPVGFSTSVVQLPGKTPGDGYIIIFRNLRYLMNLRTQIERMDRLATLGELSAGIAHEIRNPLAGIKVSAQVLEESFSPADFRSQLVSRIVKEIDRSNELLKRFFNFAKPNKPKQKLINIELLIDGVYLLLVNRLKKKNIQFNKTFADFIPQVFVDEGQIEQVILNLFLNAIDAIGAKGGNISVSTGYEEAVRLDENKPVQAAVSVKIRDDGHGIRKENLEKVFNPFFTSKPEGVGLGLSISSRLINENGGKIEVASEENVGTEFSIFLPCHEN